MATCDCKLYEPETTAKHTPGPWTAGRPDMGTIVDGVESKWIYSADDQYVAVASGRIRGEWDEVMANARLIAAAPKLLEALKRIVENGTVSELEDGEHAGLCVFTGNRVEFLKGLKDGAAAIAEAERMQP